ncbi:MAG: glutamine--tRNA ligase/YqeY domain fusion protein, partial [Clostridiales bacterium]|nr:glutamine--tRNA ligase/YqeY domain fusion protein [Clostridiales bacterium]
MADNFIEAIIEQDLANGKHKNIVTRFPPEPNGYLHIGHAKSLCINFGIKEKYKGKCYLRFDDTNPTKEETEYVESIKDDIRWLGFEWDKEGYASDYFEQTYQCAIKLIKKGLAYVCDLSPEEINRTRGSFTEPGINSPYRNRSVEENLRLFAEMREGKYADGEKVLRAKIDMASSNINMRDPVIYRILRAHHHQTGDEWVIYPMYDFAHPLGDAFDGITHSICTLEFEDHRPLYDWFTEHCDFDNPPHQYEFARLNIKNTIMSKRYLKKLVDSKVVDGWDDPRMPTLSGMRNRGYPPQAIKTFCQLVGVAKANSEVDSALLDHCVRDYLNQNANRAMVVEKPLKVIIDNWPESVIEELKMANNPNKDSGERSVYFGKEIYIEESDFSLNPPPKYKRLVVGGMIRAMGAYILKYASHKEKDGKVTELHCTYIENSKRGQENAAIKVKGVVHWVNANDCVPATLYKYSSLLLDESEELKQFDERLNPNSLEKVEGAMAESSLAMHKVGDTFQFVRSAYYKLAKVGKDCLEFYRIVELKDAFNAPK